MVSTELQRAISAGRCLEPPATFNAALAALLALLEEQRETNRRLAVIEAALTKEP